MADPVTGPTAETISNNIDGRGSFYRDRIRWRQKRPFTKSLPYRLIRIRTHYAEGLGIDAGKTDFGQLANASSVADPWQRVQANLFTQGYLQTELEQAEWTARSKFSSKLGEEAGWLINLAQRKQAMEMVGTRALQLLQFCNKLRRLDFPGAMRVFGWRCTSNRRLDERSRLLRFTRHKTEERRVVTLDTRRTAKGFADNFLELHFGWEPAVKDISASINLLDSPIPFGKLEGLGRKIPVNRTHVTTNYYGFDRRELTGYVRAVVGAEVLVTNANQYLASRLGLTNLASAAFDAVPFSFILDWFVNVSEYLKQFTEFNGIQFIEPFTSWKASLSSTQTTQYQNAWYLWGHVIKMDGQFFERKLGIPSVALGLRPPWRLSPTRALTAISLLIQQGFRH